MLPQHCCAARVSTLIAQLPRAPQSEFLSDLKRRGRTDGPVWSPATFRNWLELVAGGRWICSFIA